MSKGTLIEIAISFFGIAILIGVSWLFGAMRSAVVTKEAAAERLARDLGARQRFGRDVHKIETGIQ